MNYFIRRFLAIHTIFFVVGALPSMEELVGLHDREFHVLSHRMDIHGVHIVFQYRNSLMSPFEMLCYNVILNDENEVFRALPLKIAVKVSFS